MFKRILLGSDGSEPAMHAAKVAAELALSQSAELTVVHVFEAPSSPIPLVGAPGIELDDAALCAFANEVREAVERRTAHVFEEVGVSCQIRQETGHPAETLVRIAENEGYDLIVVGSRGLSAIGSFLLGSVSDKVSHHAHCPVLIVR